MHELLSHPPPREIWPALCVIAALAIGLALFIASVGPPEPERPWRWGDPPRRPDTGAGLAGWIGGIVLASLMVSVASTMLR